VQENSPPDQLPVDDLPFFAKRLIKPDKRLFNDPVNFDISPLASQVRFLR
jgi:hypothetical protein